MRKYIGLLLFMAGIFLSPFPAVSGKSVSLPYNVPNAGIKSLRGLVDPDLEDLMIRRLNRHKTWAKLIAEKKMCVGLVDLSDPLNVKYARINGNVMLYAASLPKIAVLLAAFESFEDGSLRETSEIQEDLRAMISRSDNAASTRMIERIGMEKINGILTSKRYQLYDEDYGGGLWVGKEYAKNGRRIPDPLGGLSHAATVSQVCRFYYLLALGRLVNRERSAQMLDILANPEIEHKFVSALREVVPLSDVHRKSGTWKIWHADSVLVWGPKWRKYIAVALIEDPEGEKIMRALIPELENILKPKYKYTAWENGNQSKEGP